MCRLLLLLYGHRRGILLLLIRQLLRLLLRLRLLLQLLLLPCLLAAASLAACASVVCLLLQGCLGAFWHYLHRMARMLFPQMPLVG